MLFVLVSVTKHRTCGAIDVFLPLVDPTAFSAKKKQKKEAVDGGFTIQLWDIAWRLHLCVIVNSYDHLYVQRFCLPPTFF